MAYIDFTTGTETDPGGYLTVTSSRVTFTGLLGNGTTNFWQRDMGAGWRTGNFIDRFTFTISAESHATNSRANIYIVGVSAFAEGAESYESIRVRSISGGSTSTATLTLDRLSAAGTQDTPTETATLSTALTVGNVYYGEIQRTGTATTLKVYSDSSYTTQVGSTLTVTESSAMTMRYLLAVGTLWAGAATTISGYVENLNLDYSAGASGNPYYYFAQQ